MFQLFLQNMKVLFEVVGMFALNDMTNILTISKHVHTHHMHTHACDFNTERRKGVDHERESDSLQETG